MSEIKRKYWLNIPLTYEQVLDLETILCAVDGYYIQHGTRSAKLWSQIYDEVEKLKQEAEGKTKNDLVGV